MLQYYVIQLEVAYSSTRLLCSAASNMWITMANNTKQSPKSGRTISVSRKPLLTQTTDGVASTVKFSYEGTVPAIKVTINRNRIGTYRIEHIRRKGYIIIQPIVGLSIAWPVDVSIILRTKTSAICAVIFITVKEETLVSSLMIIAHLLLHKTKFLLAANKERIVLAARNLIVNEIYASR